MNIHVAMARFHEDQMAKFDKRDAKLRATGNGESSATAIPNTLDWEKGPLINHLWEEILELKGSDYADTLECADVANMAFLLWWYLTERAECVPQSRMSL